MSATRPACVLVVALWLALLASVAPAHAHAGAHAAGRSETSPGLRAYWSEGLTDCQKLGHVDWARFEATSVVDAIDFPRTSGAFRTGGAADHFGARFVGTVTVPASGLWTFLVTSDEGVRLWINGELLVNDGTPHSSRTRSGSVTLAAGEHDIEVRYLERRYSAELVLSWSGPGTPQAVVPPEAFSHPAEEPVFDAGGEGLWVYWYDGVSHASDLGHVDWAEHSRVGVAERVSHSPTDGAFDLGGPADHFAARYVGVLTVPEAGEWTFELGSDEAAALLINGAYVIADPTPHSYRWRAGTVTLSEGEHAIEVRYLERRYTAGLKLAWRGPGDEHVSVIPGSAFAPGSGSSSPGSGGLIAQWYDGVSHATAVGQIDWSSPSRVGTEPNVSWSLTGGPFETGGPSDHFALRLVGTVQIPRSGSWTFGLGSDESARLLINGAVVVNDDAAHSFRFRDGTVSLAAGAHEIEVLYLERRYSAGLVLTWQGPGDPAEEVIPREAFAPVEPASDDPPARGLRAYWAEGLSHARSVGQVNWSDTDAMTIVPNIAWKLTSGAFRAGGATDHFGVRLVGQVTLDRPGSWEFSLGSDESARLYINGQLLINDDVAHSYRWRDGTVELPAGAHDFEVRYLERRYSAGLTVTWTPPGGSEEVIPPGAFSHPSFETPFDPGGGGLRAYFSEGVTHAREVGQVDWERHDHTELVDTVAWRITSGAFRDSGPADHFGVRLVGRVDVPQTGEWTFALGSDESAILFVDGEPVAVDPVAHSFRWVSGTVTLRAGLRDIEVRYLERRYSAGLFLTWRGPGVPAETVIPASAFSLRETEEPFEAGGGLRAFWSEGQSHAQNVGQIDWAEFDTQTTIQRVSWNITGGPFRLGGAADHFGLRATGLLEVPAAGVWTFGLGSDESAQLYINGEQVISDHTAHSFRWATGEIELDAGTHDFEVRYLERRYAAGLTVTWRGPGMDFAEVIPSAAFSPHPVEPAFDDGPAALQAAWYERLRDTARFLENGTPAGTTTEKRVSWRITSDAFRPGGSRDHFGVSLTGRLTVPREGMWTFRLGSDESAVLLVNGVTVVDDATYHSFRFREGAIELGAGEHTIEVRYAERRYSAGLFLTWQGPGDACESVIPASAFGSRAPATRVVRWREVDPGR